MNSFSKTSLVCVLSLGFCHPIASHAAIDLGGSLTSSQLQKTGEYLSGFSMYYRLQGAGSHGKGAHIEIAAHAEFAKLQPLRDALGPPNDANIQGSIIGVPRAVIRMSYNDFTLGMGFIPPITIEGAKIQLLSGEFMFHVGDYFKLPFKAEIRGHAGDLALAYNTTVGGSYQIPVEVAVKFLAYGASFGISQPFGPSGFTVEPYTGLGIIGTKSDYGDAAAIAGLFSNANIQQTYKKTMFHWYVGLNFSHFNRFSWALELQKMGYLWYVGFGMTVRVL